MSSNHSAEIRLILLEDRQDRTDKTMVSVAETLKLLAAIPVQAEGLAKSLASIEARVAEIETDWPLIQQLKAGAAWAMKIILSGALIAVLAVAGVKLAP